MSDVMVKKADSCELILTDAAKAHLLAHLSKQPKCLGVRFSVKKTGCSGLSYVVDYVSEVDTSDIAISLTNDYKMYVKKTSYPFLKGMTVDYIQQGLNYKFVFHNPNQTGQCGCGESFTVTALPDD